ncbi:MAG TPA: type II CAAX endopeptidase family protein [Bacillota bacterium]|nr:type II CAAX endopeptidase family protein [Bacillota bacterium]
MLFYVIGLILTCLMLVALPKEAYQGDPFRIMVMVMIYAAIYFSFFTRKGKAFIQKGFANPFRAALILMILLNLFAIGITGVFSVVFLGKSVAAFLIPALLVYAFKAREGRFHPIDIVTFLLAYLFILLKIPNLPMVKFAFAGGAVSLNGIYSLMVLFLLFLFVGTRKIELGLEFKFTPKMLLWTLIFAVILIPVDLFIGVQLKFISYSGFHSSLLFAGISAVFMVFFASMSEEIFFRGLIYNYLAQYVSPKGLGNLSYWVPLLISSLIFGATHLDKFGWAMFPLATIAGIFYGLTYIKTKNLFCAVLIHTLTNLCWQLFFVTN